MSCRYGSLSSSSYFFDDLKMTETVQVKYRISRHADLLHTVALVVSWWGSSNFLTQLFTRSIHSSNFILLKPFKTQI